MEESSGATRFDSMNTAVQKKKRSYTFRRAKPDSESNFETNEESSTPPSDDVYKASSDENGGCDSNSNRKEFSLNQCISRVPASVVPDGEKSHVRDRKDGFTSNYSSESSRSGSNGKRSSEGVLAPANWKSTSTSPMNNVIESESVNTDMVGENPNPRQLGGMADGFGSESKVKKVKLKVGGVTRTIQANSASNGASRLRQKNIEENPEDYVSSSDKRRGLQGIPWKDFSREGFPLGRDNSVMGKVSGKKEADKSDSVRKSKRVPKKRVLVGEFGEEDDDDDEIRYLEKLKISKISGGYRDEDDEPKRKHRKLSLVSNIEDGKKKSKSGDTDYEEEEDLASDGEIGGKNKPKKQRKEPLDSLMDGKREITLTTRQRALQSSKDSSSLIEFPNGLPPAPPRKQKEKLTDVEQQLKKAEAAQRRRVQVEKAARESEAEAIRKILGQDSSRKKREDKIKKRQEEMAQEKAANALLNASSTVRWVMGPNGTTVSFPQEMGLPSLFDSKPHSYPPPREMCAGPSCTNAYKYRDSKSKLPLCSLQCYKAVQDRTRPETTC